MESWLCVLLSATNEATDLTKKKKNIFFSLNEGNNKIPLLSITQLVCSNNGKNELCWKNCNFFSYICFYSNTAWLLKQ